jgi:hypothetical protein
MGDILINGTYAYLRNKYTEKSSIEMAGWHLNDMAEEQVSFMKELNILKKERKITPKEYFQRMTENTQKAIETTEDISVEGCPEEFIKVLEEFNNNLKGQKQLFEKITNLMPEATAWDEVKNLEGWDVLQKEWLSLIRESKEKTRKVVDTAEKYTE